MSNEVDSKPVSTMDGEKYLILRTNSTLDLYDSVLTDIERQFIAGYLICIGEVSTKTSRHFNIQTRIILKTHGFEDPNYIAVNAITVTEKTRKNGWDHFVMFITASPTLNSPLLSYSTLDIGILGLIGNLIVWVVFCRFKSLRIKSSILILNLSLADLGMCAFGFPFVTIAALEGRWRFGEVTCRWYAFNGMFFGLASIGCLASIGLDRYMLTCRYHKYLELETKHYVGLSLAVWLNALFWAVMPLLGWSQYTIDSSAIACLLDLSRPEIGLILYILAIFIFCFVIPLTIVGITYYKAWMKILEIGDGGAQENIEWTNHKQITKMSVVVVVMFCFTWSPYAMVHLYCIFRTTRHISPALSIVPALLAKSSAVYNPYIYAIVNKRFRLALKKMCGCICTRNDRQALQIHNLC